MSSNRSLLIVMLMAAAGAVGGSLGVLVRAAAPTTQANVSPQGEHGPEPRPVPLLTPEEEAATFDLPPGFRAEVVASEPMVEHPVHIAFDPDGRMWVAEMRAYMPDMDGWGEEKPIGRVSVLEDLDGDGRMDKSTVFAEKLVLPRAVGFAGDGVLIASPPHLLLCRDTNGDGKADTREVLLDDAGTIGNPENSFNGLLYGLDNWLYNANYEQRIRYAGDGQFEYSPVPDLGQFGIGRDDYGRLFFNTNSDYLRGALVPPHYMTRNTTSPGTLANTRIAKDQAVFPAHAATINRGYRPDFVHPDGKLKAFTAACSPWVYRGDLFPEFYGNVFVAEATSNLVRRAVFTEKNAALTAKNAYKDREFIASTYERFRPVNFATGPEGALYVVDMHHGLIQHKMSITEHARVNYKAKRLHKHLRTGRIFRIVPDDKPTPAAKPKLSTASSAQLVDHLQHPNGWWRDTAQRLLVERRDTSVTAALEEMAANAASPVHRLHALWTLEGIGIRPEVVQRALNDRDAKVRANAVRVAEPFLDAARGQPLLSDVLKLKDDPSADVRLQFVLTVSALGIDSADRAVAEVLLSHGGNYMLREAAVSGLGGREIDFLERLLNEPAWQARSDARHDVFTDLARAVTRRYDGKEMLRLAELIGAQPPERQWQQVAMLEAIPAVKKDDFGSEKPIEVPAKPAAVDVLAASKQKVLADGSAKIAALFYWPGKPVPPRPKPVPLNAKQQELFELGRQQYALICAQCHQPDGMGAEGKAPRLRNSPWVLGPDKRLIRIVLHGMKGPVEVDGTVWNLDMPSWQAMTDEQIAGVLTYVRREWGHEAPPVEPEQVHSIRDWNQARKDAWTAEELLQIR